MKVTHAAYNCRPFPYSNDHWTLRAASELRDRLNNQGTPLASRAALIIGAGTLPYTLDVIPDDIYACDKDPDVPRGIIGRCTSLPGYSSWQDYRDQQLQGSQDALEEYDRAQSSGLAGDFELAKRVATIKRIHPVIGDVVLSAHRIAEQLNRDGQVLTFINFSNVAKYLGRPVVQRRPGTFPPNGRSVLAEVVGMLPVSPDAVLVDSFESLNPRLFTPEEYVNSFTYQEASVSY